MEQLLAYKNLKTLDLGSNMFHGPLPYSICNVSSLQVINLSNNSLSGTIPQCLGNVSNLRSLALNRNQLDGLLPKSLKECKKLEVLDLGNNKIKDTFPNWLDTLPELQVLVLRSNRLHGPICNSKTKFIFPKLRIIDLSHNEFTGPLPTKYLENFKAMMNVDEEITGLRYMGNDYYQYSVTVTMKGFAYKLEKIVTIFTTIDLSDNKFQGGIPELIGNLSSLLVLNLSHNNLTGQIPPSLGSLIQLESFDLSSNILDGVIPSQLTGLTFLEVLNLSCNRLEGLIPQGKQFATFDNKSYAENLRLCGFPLSKKCSDDGVAQPPLSIQKEDDFEFGGGFGWKAMLMGYGSGLVIGIAWGYHIFLNRNPEWFLRIVERIRHKKVKRSNKSAANRRNRRRN